MNLMKINGLGWMAGAVIVMASGISASAFTSGNADTLLSGFHTAFYEQYQTGLSHYKSAKTGGDTGFWTQAEIIESLESAYQRTGNTTHRDMITKVLNGFSNERGTSWSGNSFNDDVMWACIAYLRGYSLTGNTTFRTIAKSNFDMAYARSYDTANGGFFRTSSNSSKNSAVNGPASIAAYKLYQALGDSGYYNKAVAINNWQRANCYNEANGQVYDSPSSQTPTTYNQGTFLAACYYRGSTGAAQLACDYLKTMGSIPTGGTERLMPAYGNGTDNSGFNSIGIRYASQLMKNMGTQSRYLSWLQANAQAAWDARRPSDNLSWQNWHTPLLNGTVVGAWDCVNSQEALQVVPPNQ